LVFKAYNCVASSKNRSADAFKQQAFFTMFEDWQLQAHGKTGEQTRVIKTWRNLEQQRLFFIPKSLLIASVKLTAKLERRVLVRSWNREARKEA
jgi:hypothetical protein